MQNLKSKNGFFNNFDAYDPIIWPGMESHYLGRNGKGPGAYLKTNIPSTSNFKHGSKFSMSKNDRGLLTSRSPTMLSPSPREKPQAPSPHSYNKHDIGIKQKSTEPAWKMSKASRDFSFSKYGSQH